MKKSRSIPFSRAIFSSSVLITSVAVVCSLTLALFLLRRTVVSSFESRFQSTQELFAENISYDVLSGAYSEAYSKCKVLMKDNTVMAVKVVGLDGAKICNIRRKGSASVNWIETPIYFDSEKKEVATVVRVAYSRAAEADIMRQSLAVLGITLLVLFLGQILLARRISRNLSRSIQGLSKMLKAGNLHTLATLDPKPKEMRIREVATLYEEVKQMADNLLQYQRKLVQSARDQALHKMARQVAHDIRSPLATLSLATDSFKSLPEENRTIATMAMKQIQGIAHGLLEKSQPAEENATVSSNFVAATIASAVLNKQTEYREFAGLRLDWQLKLEHYGLFAKADSVELRRILSNLVNNAAEALQKNGSILVKVEDRDSMVEVSVSDDGPGIDDQTVHYLNSDPRSIGKKGGQGLGLAHAKQTLERWGGRLEIASQIGKGTRVSCFLVKTPPPAWFVPELVIPQTEPLVIVDDDASIHEVWKKRLMRTFGGNAAPQVLNFNKGSDLKRDLRKNSAGLYLVDLELGEEESGLDVIDALQIQEKSVLVSSSFEDSEILTRCESMRVRFIPKGMVSQVPLRKVQVSVHV